MIAGSPDPSHNNNTHNAQRDPEDDAFFMKVPLQGRRDWQEGCQFLCRAQSTPDPQPFPSIRNATGAEFYYFEGCQVLRNVANLQGERGACVRSLRGSCHPRHPDLADEH